MIDGKKIAEVLQARKQAGQGAQLTPEMVAALSSYIFMLEHALKRHNELVIWKVQHENANPDTAVDEARELLEEAQMHINALVERFTKSQAAVKKDAG